MPTPPKSAIGRQGLTIHLSAEDVVELDQEIAEYLAAAPAAKLTRGPMAEWILRQHLAARRAARQPLIEEAPAEPRARRRA